MTLGKVFRAPYSAIEKIVRMPWVGAPIRWLLPLWISSFVGVLVPSWTLSSLDRTWLCVSLWLLLRFVMSGPVAILIIPYLFLGSVGIYLFNILLPLAFYRAGGAEASFIAATVSSNPGFFYVVRTIGRISNGSGMSWPEVIYAWALLGSFCVTGRHLYDDLTDYMRFRFRIRAPLWALILFGLIGCMFAEVLRPLTPWVHVLGAILAFAFGVLLFAFGEVIKSLLRRWFGRLKSSFSKRGAITSGVASKPSVAPVSAGKSADSPVSENVVVPEPGAKFPAGQKFETAGDSPFTDDGSLSEEFVVEPEAGVSASGAGEAVEVAQEDEFGETEWGDSRLAEAENKRSHVDILSEGTADMGEFSHRFSVYWNALENALDGENVNLFSSLMNNLTQQWISLLDESQHDGGPSYILTRFGSIPLGRSLLRVLALGLTPREGLHQLLDSRVGGDEIEDEAWKLDRLLVPASLKKYGTKIENPGGGDDAHLPTRAVGSVAETEGLRISFDNEEEVGSVDGELEDHEAELYDQGGQGGLRYSDARVITPVGSRGTTSGGSSVGAPSRDFEDSESPQEPIRLPYSRLNETVPAQAASGHRSALDQDDPVLDSEGPGGLVSPVAEETVGPVKRLADKSFGIGETDSEEPEHSLEVEGDMLSFLSQTSPMEIGDLSRELKSSWIEPSMVAAKLSTSVDDLSPDAPQLASFMENLLTLAESCKISDRAIFARVLLSLLALSEGSLVAQLEQRRSKLAYALCGPWRRSLHANVGRMLQAGLGSGDVDMEGEIDALIASMESILYMFADLGVTGSAVKMITERRDRLVLLKSAASESSKARGVNRSGREESLMRGRAMVLRSSLDQSTQLQIDTLEDLARIRDRMQAVIAMDSVYDSTAQLDHPLVMALRDLLVRGKTALDRIELGVQGHASRKRIGNAADLLNSIMSSLPDEALTFVAEISKAFADPANIPVSSKDMIDSLRLNLGSLKRAESDRIAAQTLSPRQKVDSDWKLIAANPFETIMRRKAMEEELVSLSSGELKPEWAMIQLREISFLSGFKGFIHDSGVPPDIKRVLLLPLFGGGMDWTVDKDGLLPVGGSFYRFDIKKFIDENMVSIRSQRINDVRILLVTGQVSPEIEDQVLSRRLDRNQDLTREDTQGKWFRGTVVTPEDLIGSKGNVGKVSGMYYIVTDLINRTSQVAAV